MTTQEKMIFEERLEEANPFLEYVKDNVGAAAFNTGARWAREETLREVFGLLRSEDFKIAQRRETILGESLTDWLESNLIEPIVVMKDPMYRIPDDEL